LAKMKWAWAGNLSYYYKLDKYKVLASIRLTKLIISIIILPITVHYQAIGLQKTEWKSA
jgi:hypothetical protein